MKQSKYHFMSFKGPKNIVINGLLLFLAVMFLWTMKKRANKEDEESPASLYGSSSTSARPSFILPKASATQVVAKKPTALFAPRNRY